MNKLDDSPVDENTPKTEQEATSVKKPNIANMANKNTVIEQVKTVDAFLTTQKKGQHNRNRTDYVMKQGSSDKNESEQFATPETMRNIPSKGNHPQTSGDPSEAGLTSLHKPA